MPQITILAMMDVVGALADGSVSKNLYFIDDNGAYGSTDEGTETLKTKVEKGDELIWITRGLQAETFVEISGIEPSDEGRSLSISKETYPGTDITFWTGKVLRDLNETVEYKVAFRLGSHPILLCTTDPPAIFGNTPSESPPSSARAKAPTGKKTSPTRARKRKES